MQQHEEQVRQRAYALWDSEGRPDGRDQDFWYRAERQLSERGTLDVSEEMNDQQSEAPMPAGFQAH
ncbi:MAG TPA: DUF2934 domain-containing protein [Devosia sp.]